MDKAGQVSENPRLLNAGPFAAIAEDCPRPETSPLDSLAGGSFALGDSDYSDPAKESAVVNMAGKLGQVWETLNKQTIGTDSYWDIAVQNRAFYRDMLPVVEEFATKKTLDVGAGELTWRYKLPPDYIAVDLYKEHPELNVICDATQSLPFSSETFDTVFCVSVLEHAKEPWNSL